MERTPCICAIFMMAVLPVVSAPEIRIEIQGIASTNGQVLVALFSQSKGFPSDHTQADRTASVKPVTNATSLSFTNVTAGSYAIAVCHDSNANGRMDTKRFGQPIEGFAVFRNQKTLLGPPSFKKSAFTVSTNSLSLKMKLQYPDKQK